jgi:putative FmdB family regulatory protein
MPIYEYECGACGHRLESIQKMSDAPLTECPSCHKNALQKLVSAAGFQLKGTGWYATDFRDKGRKEKKPDTTESSQSDVTKTDSSSGSTDTEAK